jgi:hypothetical protein
LIGDVKRERARVVARRRADAILSPLLAPQPPLSRARAAARRDVMGRRARFPCVLNEVSLEGPSGASRRRSTRPATFRAAPSRSHIGRRLAVGRPPLVVAPSPTSSSYPPLPEPTPQDATSRRCGTSSRRNGATGIRCRRRSSAGCGRGSSTTRRTRSFASFAVPSRPTREGPRRRPWTRRKSPSARCSRSSR